jgi:mannonate dehydratase
MVSYAPPKGPKAVQSQIKLSMMIKPEPEADELAFARQLGLGHVYTWVPDELSNAEALIALKRRVADAGLTLYNVGNFNLGKSPLIHLGLPGRDEVIERYADFLRALSAAEIYTTTFTWEPDRVWSSPRSESRGASARHVDLAEMTARPLTHEREYTLDELWDNFEYFIKAILPVCEETGVRLALHPNDPPTDQPLGGIPCLITSYERYNRAFEIAGDSPYLGMEFCTGCWLEGGDAFGNMLAAIREFVERGKIFIVHFRNVTAPLPVFTETFLDNGYMDMYQAMRIFVETGYDGTMILDHTPQFAGDYAQGGGTAYAIGYMRALIERAEDELSAGK